MRWGVVAAIAAVIGGCGDGRKSSTDVAKREAATTSTVAPTTSTERIEEIRARRLRKALASIARHINVPVMLPSDLPEGVRLAQDPTINNASSQVLLDIGMPRFLRIEYGVATLESCEGFRRVNVGDAPGLISAYKTRHDGSSKDIPFRTVVWPATPELPTGRYGISGTFSVSKILAFARAMKGSTAFKPRASESNCFESVQTALDYIAKHVDVPAVVPANLPRGTEVSGAGAGPGHAQLHLRLPGSRGLTIQYGEAGFDGCGPRHPRQVKVGANPAVIEVSKVRTSAKRKASTYTTLVWPATLKDLEGRYGLSGEFSEKEMIAFAESMEHARAAAPRGPKTNC